MNAPPGSSTGRVDRAIRYRDDGMVLLRGLLGEESIGLLAAYLNLMGHIGRMHNDQNQVDEALVLYGDPLFDTVMASLVPTMCEVVGETVAPTYSFVRVYFRGQELVPHRDRPACEHSLTVHVAAATPEPWPVWFADREGVPRSFELGPGDAALYQGCELRHWREECPVDWYAQTFLHFVSAKGPFGAEVFDRRAYLGLPSERKA